MSDCCDPTPVLDVVLGDSVHLSAGPFYDAAGTVINLTTWTITLTLQAPDGTERAAVGTPSGSSTGIMSYTTQAGELDAVDVWTARFKGVSGTTQRSSELLSFRVIAALP